METHNNLLYMTNFQNFVQALLFTLWYSSTDSWVKFEPVVFAGSREFYIGDDGYNIISVPFHC